MKSPSFRQNRLYGKSVSIGHFFVHYDPEKVDLERIQDLLVEPDRYLNKGEKIASAWQNSAIDKFIATVANEQYFVKRYNCLGGAYKLRNCCRKSKALKAWLAGGVFHHAGISTPRPVICLEEYRFGFLGRAYLYCDFIEDGVSLLEVWPTLDDTERNLFLDLVASEVGRMHRLGILHGDLNWRNILIRKGSQSKIYLVDLDGCRYIKHLGQKKALSDLNHFYRDLDRNKASQTQITLFTQRWQYAAQFDCSSSLAY